MLEFTENVLIDDRHSEATLAELKGLGVRLAIDDFGTGFSSLGQLRHVPVDMIKVDGSFVQGATGDARDAAITANLVNLAHALGIIAIAEGIESEEQLSSLRGLGCDLGQGFLLARPMPAGEVTDLLARSETGPAQDSAVA